MTVIPFGEWKPDEADFASPACTVAKNVVPRTTKDYGPLPAITAFSDALTARCQGGYAAKDKAATVFNFAADASKIYRMSAGAWTDISITAGYTVSAEDAVEFTRFEERIVTVNGLTDPMQSYTLGVSSLFTNLVGHTSAPAARHVATLDPGFIMVGNTTDENSGAHPDRVWWSANFDPADWPTPGTADAQSKQSDYNEMPGGGWVQKIIGGVGGATGAVFMEHSIYRVDYEGPPTVFRFVEVEKSRGTPASNSVINLGPFAAYLSEDGFYIFDGSQSVPIGAGKIDKTFNTDVDQQRYDRVWGAADPVNNMFYWVYPGSGSSNGIPNKCVIYNWKTFQWSEAEFDSEIIFPTYGTGYTLEGLDALGYTMDTLPASLDSRQWAGGRPTLSAFDTMHKLGYFTGSNLAATLETGEFPLSDRITYVDGIRPIVDGGTPTVQIGYRATQDAGVVYTTAQAAGRDNVAPARIASRYVRARVNIPAASTWEHAVGIEPRARAAGQT